MKKTSSEHEVLKRLQAPRHGLALREREVLDSFCTEGQGLHPFQHILGRKPTRTRKRANCSLTTDRRHYGTKWTDGQKQFKLTHTKQGAKHRTTKQRVLVLSCISLIDMLIFTSDLLSLNNQNNNSNCCLSGERWGLYTASSSQNNSKLNKSRDKNFRLNRIRPQLQKLTLKLAKSENRRTPTKAKL